MTEPDATVPFRRCRQSVLVPTGGAGGVAVKVAHLTAGLDAVGLDGSFKGVPGTRFMRVDLAGNDRDLAIACERLVKLGGRAEA